MGDLRVKLLTPNRAHLCDPWERLTLIELTPSFGNGLWEKFEIHQRRHLHGPRQFSCELPFLAKMITFLTDWLQRSKFGYCKFSFLKESSALTWSCQWYLPWKFQIYSEHTDDYTKLSLYSDLLVHEGVLLWWSSNFSHRPFPKLGVGSIKVSISQGSQRCARLGVRSFTRKSPVLPDCWDMVDFVRN